MIVGGSWASESDKGGRVINSNSHTENADFQDVRF